MSENARCSDTPRVVRPWWREPWPWILMAGPALAVIGCIITIVIAITHFSDQAIHDGGVKRGLIVSMEQVAPIAVPQAPGTSQGQGG
ncbi:hypothetical protein ERD78_00075 [Allopusillimonas soli]|uniref:FixH family protein n=1 Tax=Allopusillimonas soli TaxID=659016 RepID=A0A853FB17_9BURK|nr:FixH family protein [Allopusillimonas soli]NYT35256.1 FixH family protein [Allopusillimonas soli]TEA75683.1 hypothetical protein ERD78_00075 [Allopusillimonas soli]